MSSNHDSHSHRISNHTKQLNVPSNPPVWTKPAASLAAPNETIPVSRFCASHLPDYEVSRLPSHPQNRSNH